MYEMHPNFNVLYLAAAVPAGACVALFGLLFYRLLMLVYGAYVGMLVGMVIQAGLSNATPMDDVHQCTPHPRMRKKQRKKKIESSKREKKKENHIKFTYMVPNRGQVDHAHRWHMPRLPQSEGISHIVASSHHLRRGRCGPACHEPSLLGAASERGTLSTVPLLTMMTAADPTSITPILNTTR